MFSLRADGFDWTDAAVVYEELGRACVPGPLVWTLRARRDHRWARPHRAAAISYVEHLDTIDTLLVVDDSSIRAVGPGMPSRGRTRRTGRSTR